MNAIVLTDPPVVVELKREFRDLDAQEENLKERLTNVRHRKQTIAEQIFRHERTANDPGPRLAG